MKELPKVYEPQKVEGEIYRRWESSGFFNPDKLPGERKERFSIVLPPPNVTGILHLGHALTVTIEDIITRYQRMLGKKTLWLPGTDHAAIATESKVERELIEKEGKTRHDLGPAEFLKRVNQFAKESQKTILNQLRKMGASLDWSRLAFTLDEKRQHAVREAFKRMYKAGLIYHGEYLVNWDPKGQTTVSDEELVYETIQGTLYIFKYSKDFPIKIATTRPETKLGDVAVAVHPNGEWKKYIGQKFEIKNFFDVELSIEVVGDENVDPEFGTGAVGVTPAHSREDWEIAKRHHLPIKQIINEYGKIIKTGIEELDYKVDIREARERIVKWLKKEGLLEKEEIIEHNIAKAQSSGGTIEILPKRHQFFVNVNKPISERDGKTLKDLMRESVADGRVKIIPKRFEKIYFHWIDNLRDWNISRQVWYGHRIPAWYKDDEIHVADESPGEGWRSITDTLDTWFSSGLWTFSTLGWPEQTTDLKTYHPTDVLETGYDILFFWVARMILMSTYFLGDIPFRTVYLHGLVRDKDRQKMSKSKGNVIDPLGVAEHWGTDAVRMALIVGNAPGNDPVISEDKIRGYRNFANKIWNASRFLALYFSAPPEKSKVRYTKVERVMLKKLSEVVKGVTKDMESWKFHLAAEKLYHFFWHYYADIVIETLKADLQKEESTKKETAKAVLYEFHATLLKLLHPFMPFVTEYVWREILEEKELLMIESWPNT